MAKRPNILFIMSDDHASHAISAYTRNDPLRPVINETPHMDRIANEGVRLDNCFCTNSICTPSRAVILTGKYSHHPQNGVYNFNHMDNSLPTVAKDLKKAGYQTAMIGKWHLGTGPKHCPTGFDYWKVLPGQGKYHNPEFFEIDPATPGGRKVEEKGYATDLITDYTLDWLRQRDAGKPFFVMCHHKAPHRRWEPDSKHLHLFDGVELPYPATFDDDFSASAARRNAYMRIESSMNYGDIKLVPPSTSERNARLTVPSEAELADYELRRRYETPDGAVSAETARFKTLEARKRWIYQQYMKDYLRVIASIDDGIGRLLDYLDAEGLAEDTLVMYTSDQGFFLGDHGWFDKRFMYEESLRMPMLIRYPREIPAGTVNKDLVLNLDFAQTWLDYAGAKPQSQMQGASGRALLRGEKPGDWRTAMYYRYYMNQDPSHNTTAHYGIRTVGPHRREMKLIYYYDDGMGVPGTERAFAGPEYGERAREWECFDLDKDPYEMTNVYADPAYAGIIAQLKNELHDLQRSVGDSPYDPEVA
ncbi:MAG: sulfatase [Kiritimatiellae bacterium]|nr:sulfatase [Kiritimatiellia bacterium]